MVTIFSEFLARLGVRHTAEYSDRKFLSMTFKSLFGFSRLLEAYGIPSAAFTISDKQKFLKVPTPYLARRGSSFVIVENIGSGENPDIAFWLYGRHSVLPASEFLQKCDGTVLQAYPGEQSGEPDYARHHFFEIAEGAKKWILIGCTLLLLAFGIIRSGIWHNLSKIFLLAVDLAGLGVTWLLILKSLKVSSKAADSFCGVLQKHGCDHVLEDKASKFFGLFGWSEVGIAYFSISTLILLIFPEMIHNLALINGCCLPFTCWSIWYQKFRIKTWCTLCVTTQCLLWCQFLCFLFGGWWHNVFPIGIEIFVMGAAYVAATLAANRVCTFIEKRSPAA